MSKVLRDRTWYFLPDGRRVMASIATDGQGHPAGGTLHTEEEWEAYTSADREWLADGRITLLGDPTPWTTDDLTMPHTAPADAPRPLAR